MTRCGEDVTDEYAENTFHWTRDSGDMEADTTWNTAHAGMKSITFAVADIDGDVKISCTLTANGATYGSIAVDGNMDASHTPADLDANDIFVIEDGYLKVTTSRGNVYALEDGKVKGAGAKLNGSITAETKLFASQLENIVEFSYDHNGLRTQKKVTKADGTVETTDYTLHGKLITHLAKGNNKLHFFYDNESRPAMVDFNGALYSYTHNLQGDIVGILDSSGNLVVEYGYDAWGKPVVVRTLTTAYDVLAELNPFRYRGYVWDEEMGLYYLRSRHYSPYRGRFINADRILGECGHLREHSIFTYCVNQPIVLCDCDGQLPGGAIAYGYSKANSSSENEKFDHTRGENRDVYDKRIRDAYRKRQEAAKRIDAKGISMSSVPVDLRPSHTESSSIKNFSVAGSSLSVDIDVFLDERDVAYGRPTAVTWDIPDEGFEMIELIVFAKGARTVHQYKTLRLASRSGSWSGFSETWTPINRLAPVGMAANIYYEDGSMATYTLGYDGFMGDVAEGLITNGGH